VIAHYINVCGLLLPMLGSRLIMTNWLKYNLICTHCDTLFEVTTQDFKQSPTCVCDYPNELILLGWEDATVHETVTNVTSPQVVKINSNPYN
jgi:hypothetical protein